MVFPAARECGTGESMKPRRLLPLSFLVLLSACGDSTPTPAPDATTMADAAADGTTGGSGRARVRVTFSGTPPAGTQLQLAASREMTLMGIPVAFSIVNDPMSPATSEITFSAPGTYWISANLNAPPVTFGAPGPEDRTGVSAMPITIRAGEVTDVSVEILDRDR